MDNVSQRTEHTVGEIFRRWGSVYSLTHRVTPEQRRALEKLSLCRTSSLGGHMDECPDCDYEVPSYNSCHDRNCPTCQGIRTRRWLEKRREELLCVDYYHCVFTVPDTFNKIIFAAPVAFYSILFQATWGTLSALFRKAGYGTPGVLAALHSWGSNLWLHPHIHCVVTGGGLADDEASWTHCPKGWLLDVREMSCEFRKRFLRLLKRRRGQFASAPVDLDALISTEAQRDWVVYCKPPARDAEQVVGYLSGYAFRTAIANKRILEVSGNQVIIDCKNYRKADSNGMPKHVQVPMDGVEFIRRFMLHILPDSFKRIRCYGIWAGSCKDRKLEAARKYLPEPLALEVPEVPVEEKPAEIPEQFICPKCGGHLRPGKHIMPVHTGPIVMPFRATEGDCHAA